MNRKNKNHSSVKEAVSRGLAACMQIGGKKQISLKSKIVNNGPYEFRNFNEFLNCDFKTKDDTFLRLHESK